MKIPAIRAVLLGLATAAALGLPAAAAECGAGGSGATTIHYATGVTSLSAEDKARLSEFAGTAKFRTSVCIFAQVDAQGTEAANQRVAEGRAQTVKRFLIGEGVPEDRILIAKEDESFTLFGLLSEDKANERRVTVSYD